MPDEDAATQTHSGMLQRVAPNIGAAGPNLRSGVAAGGHIGTSLAVNAPSNLDTFTGLMQRLDTHLELLEQLEGKLEGHANKLVAVAPAVDRGPGERGKSDGDDSATPVILRLQRRCDRLATLVERMKHHQERADRVF